MSGAPNLVGRAPELAIVDMALIATHGVGPILFSGDPGVGKTALLDYAAAKADQLGFEVIRATGAEFDADVSFSRLSELFVGRRGAFEGLSDTYRGALEVVLGLGQGTAPSALIVANAALAALEHSASYQPVALIVDDLQWIDRASAVALAFVARRASTGAVRFLGASRLRSVFCERAGLAQHHIHPLTEQGAAELIETRFPTITGRTHQRLLTAAQGNPLALLELGTVAAERAHPPVFEPLSNVLPLNRRLRSLYAARIQRLPTATRELMLLAALDSGGDIAVLDEVAAGATLTTLAPAERDGLLVIREDGRSVAFRHPLVRATVVELARDIERRRAHYSLATALVDQPERHAWHLAEASVEPDEQVAALLEKAARVNLRKGDAVAAADALVRASELSPQRADRTRRMLEAASLRAEVTGELGAASHMLRTALQDEPAVTDSLAATITAAHVLINAECEVDDAHRLLVAAIDKYPHRHNPTDETLTDALFALLMVCWMSGRAQMWAPLDAAIARLRPLPPTLLTLCRSTFGDPAHNATTVLEQFGPVLTRLQHEHNPFTITRIATGCVYADRLGECREPLQRVVRDGRNGGAVALAINALVSSCVDHWWSGKWDEADESAAEGISLSEKHGYRRYSFILGGYIRALVSAARGDDGISEAAAEDLTNWAAVTGSGIAAAFAHHLRAITANAAGNFERAYHEATQISPAGTLAPFAPHALWVLFDLVEAAIRTGRHTEATAHVTAMREAGIAKISPRLALIYRGCAAMTAPADRATPLFEDALAVRGATRWPFDFARVQLAYGEHLRRAHLTAEASTQCIRALDAFENLGASPWTARATMELRGTGVPTPVRAGAGGPALTAQDREIATLAASGLSNKQIAERVHLSHRTVGARLGRIYRILGISSRAALYDALEAQQRR
jgi:DNA-binding CsgD family transcriptional regulator